MTPIALLTLLAFANPFWVDKPLREWTDQQLSEFLTASPWAQSVPGPGKLGNFPPIQVFFATAAPIRQAEQEAKRRLELRRPADAPSADDPFAEEYRLWLEEFGPTQLILAIRVTDTQVYSNATELKQLEEESFMGVGRTKIRMTGYFPPTVRDPFLRIAFPRQVALRDKEVRFELYIPGVAGPFRAAEFKLEPMVFGGKLEL